jgi:predicted NUDIX family NTP pyrophosphohydrolase
VASKTSAGILLYRKRGNALEVLLVHPGGPFWARKDAGAWTIPKGEVSEGETPLTAALREFKEETGISPTGSCLDLGVIRQAGGKTVQGFALEGDCDPSRVTSNMFEMEWPPRSGRRQSFPEIDKAAWYPLSEGRRKINAAQAELLSSLERLVTHIGR